MSNSSIILLLKYKWIIAITLDLACIFNPKCGLSLLFIAWIKNLPYNSLFSLLNDENIFLSLIYLLEVTNRLILWRREFPWTEACFVKIMPGWLPLSLSQSTTGLFIDLQINLSQ